MQELPDETESLTRVTLIVRILKVWMNNDTNDEKDDVEWKEEGRVHRYGSKLDP